MLYFTAFYRPSAANLPSSASFPLLFLFRPPLPLFLSLFFLDINVALFSHSFHLLIICIWGCWFSFFFHLLIMCIWGCWFSVLLRFDFFHLFFTILLDTLSPSFSAFSSLLRICLGVVLSHYLRNNLIAYSYVILTTIYADTICDI